MYNTGTTHGHMDMDMMGGALVTSDRREPLSGRSDIRDIGAALP